jgi:acyl-CoA reductase-like NAD-dependent aldehyde dehydrogenase
MSLLDNLGIKEINFGACTGPDGWLSTEGGKILESVNPTTGKVIATVRQCSEDDYETVIKTSIGGVQGVADGACSVRGQLVRKIADRLRDQKDDLGSLVSLGNGEDQAGRVMVKSRR